MKKISKKIMAIAMAAVMMSSSITVFAANDQVASGTATGGGQGVGGGKTDVFQVVLPTNTEGTFDFILDPQQLLYDYDSSTYDENATVYFGENNATDSEDLEIVNHSSMGVDVSVDAEMTTLSGVSMADSNEFEGDETSLYLALVLDDAEGAIALTEDGMVTATTSLAALDKDCFEWSGSPLDPDSKRQLKDPLPEGTDEPTTTFHMTGACNSNADWSKLFKSKTFNPTFEVTWTIVPSADGEEVAGDKAPSAPATFNYTKGSTATINVNLGSGDLAATSIKSVSGSTSAATGPWSAVTGLSANGSTITLANVWSGASAGNKRWIQVTFDDSANTQCVIEVTIQ